MRVIRFGQVPVISEPVPRRGRPPRMTYFRWQRTQGVEIGGTSRTAWYWRCPKCRQWAGSYPDAIAAKQRGMDHKHNCPGVHKYQSDQDPEYRHLQRPRCSCGWRCSGFVAADIAPSFYARHVREVQQGRAN